MSSADSNIKQDFDQELVNIAHYVNNYEITSNLAYDTAYYCLMDSIACALQALDFPECTKHLGPYVPGTIVPNGARVIGTSHVLDPIKAAYDNGVLIRWLDYNDTWLAKEWGHPSDNFGGILAVADFLARQQLSKNKPCFTVKDVLTFAIKAHEIQGGTALENSFNKVGLDHVVLVKLASTAVVTKMLGGKLEDITSALSQVFVDGQSLRTYRHAPNTGSRKSWAAGDATARAVKLAMLTLKGEVGYPSALTAKNWGFYDVCFKQNKFAYPDYFKFSSYVMENVLFKISYPAEFHAQTAAEAAILLHPLVKNKLDSIAKIALTTQEPAVRIISKTGPLHNPADRDHCLQYIVAIGLIHGSLTAQHYEDSVAIDPRIDFLRECMTVSEDKQFTVDYYDPSKRAIGNSVQVFFNDGSCTDKISIDYPVGHKNRRSEGLPLLEEKFQTSVMNYYSKRQASRINDLFSDKEKLLKMPINELMDGLVL
ncbi:MAG: bifunctional 2-methylcitrate dehydratase/aconitate hydratase [Gammaproteobacteria bacterium]|nr:bifunctional 2-methylcitrate dehydratase/aconitate hydratase [Gammaproteobacteria bacterium]